MGPSIYHLIMIIIIFLSLFFADKNSQRPPRGRYGRLSVDSDENCNRTTNTNTTNRQKYNNPFDELDNFDILDDSAKCSPNDNCGNARTQEHNDNDSDIELDSASSKSNCNERNDNTINRLQAMVISDDDDYGKRKIISHLHSAYTWFASMAIHLPNNTAGIEWEVLVSYTWFEWRYISW